VLIVLILAINSVAVNLTERFLQARTTA